MEQLNLIHESVNDALRSAIAALGGVKRVASNLRPAWEPDRAQKWLSNALDETRPEKLEIHDYIWIFREAKRIGYHAAMSYFARECEYDAAPVEPETELARLQRDYINAVRALSMLTPKIEEQKARLSVAR
jgi:hypothetical protein